MTRVRVPRLSVEMPLMDGLPRRSLACVNMRYEEKVVFDVVAKWWCGRTARPLRQADVMSRLMALALSHPDADLPPGLVEGRAP